MASRFDGFNGAGQTFVDGLSVRSGDTLVEVESFSDAASAEVFAGALRACGLEPQVSIDGPLGVPPRFFVSVPASELVVAQQVLEQGRTVTEEEERQLRSQWLKVPSAVIEEGLATIRKNLRVMCWSQLALPASVALAIVPASLGWGWLPAIPIIGLGVAMAAWTSRAVDQSRCPRCGDHYFTQTRNIAKYFAGRCIRCGLELRELMSAA